MKIKIKKLMRAVWFPLVCGSVVFLLFRFVFLFGHVPTSSMEPTLKKDSYFLGVRIYQDLNVGDIVVFEHEGRLLVKRIAAGPNDIIVRDKTSLMIPEKHYYMLGDNPDNSYDARFWDDPFISETQIVARVIIIDSLFCYSTI